MESKFEHSALEKDIQRLTQEIKEYKEGTPETLSDREILRSVIGSKIQFSPTPKSQQPPSALIPQYLKEESPETQLKVEELIDFALHKGIDNAIAEAKKYGPFILDSLHDALTGKVYEELKRRKLI